MPKVSHDGGLIFRCFIPSTDFEYSSRSWNRKKPPDTVCHNIMKPTRAFFTFFPASSEFRFDPPVRPPSAPLLDRQHLLHRLRIVGPQPHGRRHRHRRPPPRPGPGPGPQRPPPHVRQHPGQRRAPGRLRPAGEAAHDDAVAAGAGRGAPEAAAEGGLLLLVVVAGAGIWKVFNSHACGLPGGIVCDF